MTVKTITITEDAYDSLKRLKHGEESFSTVIKRVSGQKLRIREIIGILGTSEEEAEDYKKRVKEIRERMSKGMRERINDVRARFISDD